MSAFRGLRVLDFSQGVAGPMASMLLADFDAEVVKIEPPGGDRLKDHPGYIAWNRNKAVMRLDLAAPADRARARALIAAADVAVFDQAPGVLEPLALDPARLVAANPRLICAWMPPYGASARWSALAPHHSLLTALTGDALRQGAHGEAPVHLVLPVLWYGQAVTAAAAIGAALLERSNSGVGQALTVSGLHGAATMALLARVPAVAPLGRTHPQGGAPNYRLYECSDGQWLFLGTLFEGFFTTAMTAMGQTLAWAELEPDPEGTRERLAAAFRARPRQAWLDLLMAAGVPCAPIETRETWFDSPVVAESGLRVSFDHPERGAVAFPGAPIKLSATPASIRGLATPSDGPDWPPRAPPKAGRPRRPGAGPLDGVRVLDLGAVVAGAHAGDILANLGADVIKVEPAAGDPFRSDGALFLAYNRGKRGLGVDLKQPAGLALFHDLARTSDVVLDNYRQGVRKRLGIDYAALQAINPRIISCSINAYGDAGPRAALPGFDPLLQAESGMMAGQGGADAPVYYGIPVNDAATAATAAFGIIAALNAREATGEGQEVLTSLMAQSLMFQIGEITSYEGRPPGPLGGRDCLGVGALHRFYACADGWLALVCETPAEALALGRALEVAIGDPAAALAAVCDSALSETLSAAFATRPRAEALEVLAAASVPAAPVLSSIDAFEASALRDEGVIEPWPHPRIGPVISARAYADLAATPAGFRDPTPELGQHSRDLLTDLGLPPDQIAALFATGAVFEPAP